jgi:hypothetical protein
VLHNLTPRSALKVIFSPLFPLLYTSYAKLVATFYRISKIKKNFIVHLQIVSPAGPPLPTENVGIFEEVYKIETDFNGRYSGSLRAGRFGDSILVGAKFSAPI